MKQNLNAYFRKISRKSDESEFISFYPSTYEKGKTKFIVVTGGVMSGVGKGVFTSSLIRLLKEAGFKVEPVKFDGYLNVDAGTMNPFRHGEVFVLSDGTETDMDLGTYERFLDSDLSKDNYLTSGKIFLRVIEKERKGEYLGRDVLVIPHVTGEVKYHLRELSLAKKADFVVIEVGGTIGDIENAYFVEAMRELAYEEGRENCMFIHVTLVPEPETLEEQKSKPTQHSVKALLSMGVQPDVIVCRSKRFLSQRVREKISLFCNVPPSHVISLPNIEVIYEAPLLLKKQGLHKIVFEKMKVKPKKNLSLDRWKKIVYNFKNPVSQVDLAIVGKYANLRDSYFSVREALIHAAIANRCKVNLTWVDTTNLTRERVKEIASKDGIVVPGGFGARGTEGIIKGIEIARTKKIPFLGLCFGFQLSVVEFARNVCGLNDANSAEINPDTPHPVIDLLPEQKNIEGLGGSMRLGCSQIKIVKGTMAYDVYGRELIEERHRHRYEVNADYSGLLVKNGLVFSGFSIRENLPEILEIPGHPFFLATQFHPEFTSRPLSPSPPFVWLIKKAIAHRRRRGS